MAFSISTRPRGYDDLFSAMVQSVPPGTFYDFGRPIVMWTRQPIGFVLTSDNPGYPVRIIRERLGDFDLGVDQGNQSDEMTVVPQLGALQTLFYITLGRGRNRLIAQEILPSGLGRSKVLEVVATTNTVIYEAFGKEIFKSSERAQLQRDAIFSRYSTRLLDQLSGVGDVLPDLQTLKILSTRMLVRAFVHFPATQLGVRNEIEAVTLNTPVFEAQREGSNYQIETNRIMRTVENLAGQEAHIWFPNLAVTRWLAFIRMANNFRNNYTLESVRDDYVTVTYKGRTNIHKFDYDAFGQNFLTNLSLSDCFNNIAVTASVLMKSRMQIACWTYPFDYYVTTDSMIGQVRVSMDMGIPFDSGVPFDAEPTDPWTDGWLGWSLSGRFDQGPVAHPLDSMVQPSLGYTGPATSYQGPYTQLLNSDRSDTEIDYLVTASGLMDTYVGSSVVGLGVDLNNLPDGEERGALPLTTAGVPLLLCVKYVDVNGMSNKSGTGVIQITEPLTNETEYAPVAAGFVYIYYTPTVAISSTHLNLTDGTLTGVSPAFKVVPNVFAALTVTPIANQLAGQPFVVTIQAVDAWGNAVSVVSNPVVHVQVQGGLDTSDPSPRVFTLVDGVVTATLSLANPGTGTLRFSSGSIQVYSNSFTVS